MRSDGTKHHAPHSNSLNAAERRLLDAEAARTGRSISALIRDAVEATDGAKRTSVDDIALLRQGFGARKDRDQGRCGLEGAAPVPRTPGAIRQVTDLVWQRAALPMFDDLRPPY